MRQRTGNGSSKSAVATTDALFSGIEPDTARKLLSAGLSCFAARGFEATTTRNISVDSGLSPAALYVHYSSKEELLFRITQIAHISVLAVVRAAVESDTELAGRIRAFVREFTIWHAQHYTLAKVAQYELFALSPEHFAEISNVRRETEGILRAEIRKCAKSPEFDVENVRNVTRAILSLGIDVSRWFRNNADLTPTVLGDTYATLALRMLGHAA